MKARPVRWRYPAASDIKRKSFADFGHLSVFGKIINLIRYCLSWLSNYLCNLLLRVALQIQ